MTLARIYFIFNVLLTLLSLGTFAIAYLFQYGYKNGECIYSKDTNGEPCAAIMQVTAVTFVGSSVHVYRLRNREVNIHDEDDMRLSGYCSATCLMTLLVFFAASGRIGETECPEELNEFLYFGSMTWLFFTSFRGMVEFSHMVEEKKAATGLKPPLLHPNTL